jgi:hypothetical protein
MMASTARCTSVIPARRVAGVSIGAMVSGHSLMPGLRRRRHGQPGAVLDDPRFRRYRVT